MAAMLSTTDLAIIFVVAIVGLCVALYMVWIPPMEAVVALIALVITATAVKTFT